MSDLINTIKTTLNTLFEDPEGLGAKVLEHQHPDVEIAIPTSPIYMWTLVAGLPGWVTSYATTFIPGGTIISYLLAPLNIITGILSTAVIGPRFVWIFAHMFTFIWWSSSLSMFFGWFYLWVLDAIGWVENDPFNILMGYYDTGGEKGINDEWIGTNTWTLDLTIEAIEKGMGEKFDPKNEAHMMMMKDLTWPYLYETLNLVNTFESSMVITNTVLYYIYPDMYVEADGKAKEGYPSMVATSH